jgi:hypothetical protein
MIFLAIIFVATIIVVTHLTLEKGWNHHERIRDTANRRPNLEH